MWLFLILVGSLTLVACGKDAQPPISDDASIPIEPAPDGSTGEPRVTEVVPCRQIGATTTWQTAPVFKPEILDLGVQQNTFRVNFANTNPGAGDQLSQRTFIEASPVADAVLIQAATPGASYIQAEFDSRNHGFLAYIDNFPAKQTLHVLASAGATWESQPREGFLGAPTRVQDVAFAPLEGVGFVWVWVQQPQGSVVNDLHFAVTDASGTLVRAPQQIQTGDSVLDVTVAHNGTTAALVWIAADVLSSSVFVALIQADGSVGEPMQVASERLAIPPVTATRASNTSTLVAWTEQASGGVSGIHLQQVLDDATRPRENVVESAFSVDSPALTHLYGVPALFYRVRQTSTTSYPMLSLRIPSGEAWAVRGSSLALGPATDNTSTLSVAADVRGLGVGWTTTQTASFAYLVCAR